MTPAPAQTPRHLVGFVIALALLGLFRVGLTAHVTRCGYQQREMEREHLRLIDENRRLKLEVGRKRSMESLRGSLAQLGYTCTQYDGSQVLHVRTRWEPQPPEPTDVAGRFAGAVADALGGASREPDRQWDRPEGDVVVASLGAF